MGESFNSVTLKNTKTEPQKYIIFSMKQVIFYTVTLSYTLSWSRHQNDLVTDSKVKQDEENEIRVQMGLLNNRWEELRLKALDRQSK